MSIEEHQRTLPHNLEAERSVLGAALLDRSAYDIAAQILQPGDFFRDSHSRIFSAMQVLSDAGVAIDLIPLKDVLHSSGELEKIGGAAFIAGLIDGVPHAVNVKYYAAIVKDKWRLRQAIFASTKIMESAYSEDPLEEVIESGVRSFSELAAPVAGGAVHVKDAVLAYAQAIDNDLGLGLPSGFLDLDDLVGGFELKKLLIIAARPSAGKTSLALRMADNMATAGTPVAFFSLEMSQHALAASIIAAHSHVPSEQIRRKLVAERSWSKISHAIEEASQLPMYLVEAASTLTQVGAWCRTLRKDHGVKVGLIDYIQLMSASEQADRQRELQYLSRGLKRLAEEEDMLIVALSQLSRAPEQRTDKRPQLADLRESGALEQDADYVLMIFREEMYKRTDDNAGIAELILAKNRQGPTGTVKLAFLKELAKFDNLAPLF